MADVVAQNFAIRAGDASSVTFTADTGTSTKALLVALFVWSVVLLVAYSELQPNAAYGLKAWALYLGIIGILIPAGVGAKELFKFVQAWRQRRGNFLTTAGPPTVASATASKPALSKFASAAF